MKKKIIGIFVCMLLIATVFPVVGEHNDLENEDIHFKRIVNEKTLNSENTQLKFMKAGKGLRFIRSYWLNVPPSYDGSESVPLVIVLHGSTGPVKRLISNFLWWFGSSWIEDYTNFSAKADDEGFIVVYPNSKLMAISSPLSLFFSFDVPIYPKYVLLRKLVDDVGFIEDLIGKMQQDYNIDSARIYITGLSNGGDFTYYLGSELSDTIAAIGPVAGAIAYKDEDDEDFNYIPDPENPVSVIVFHGTNDSLMPYEGDEWQIGVNESVAFWVEHNGCDPVPEINISESGRIIRRTYSNGSNGTEVILYTTVGGNHWWPGNNWPPDTQWLYDPWKEISATDLIWEFFEMHSK